MGGVSTHGHTVGKVFSPTYNTWAGMMQRCYYPKHVKFSDYGGKGIEVDPRWHKFANFLGDMGEKPEGHSIERLSNNRNYWIGNCIWLPRHLQQKNRKNSQMITWNFRTMCIADWERELGFRPNTLRCRLLRHGWSVERAMSTPPPAR